MENSEFWLEYIPLYRWIQRPVMSLITTVASFFYLKYLSKKRVHQWKVLQNIFLVNLELISSFEKIPDGLTDTESGLYISARDFARIGLLFANKGQWMGKEIIRRLDQ